MENSEHKEEVSYYWDYLTKNPHAVKRKIVIVYAGRSGSMMLSGLLEGHSHLLSFNYYCDARLYALLKEFVSNDNITVDLFKKFLITKFSSIIDVFYEHPLLPSELRQNRVNADSFMAAIEAVCNNVIDSQLTLDMLMNLVYIAYGKMLNRPLNTIQPIMIIQLHSPFFIDDWRYLFKNLNNLNLIVMVRNPLKAIDSHFYHHTYELLSPPWHDFYERIIVEYKKSFLPFFDEKLQHKSYCMFFEDLHMNTEKIMRKLCLHLNIPFEDILLEETVEGQKALLPSAGLIVSGPSKERGNNVSLKVMGLSDVSFIEYLFQDIIVDLGYPLRSNFLQRFLSALFLTKLDFLFVKKGMKDKFSKLGADKQNASVIKKLIEVCRIKKKKMIYMRESYQMHRKVSKLRIRKKETPYTFNMIKSSSN